MRRRIDGFHQEEGAWFAELGCGHDRPVADEDWARSQDGRDGRIGEECECEACDRFELPARVLRSGATKEWSDASMPEALRRSHRVREGTWGRLVVRDGRIRFAAATSPPTDVVLEAGHSQSIPPGLAHDVHPLGSVRFVLELYSVQPWYDARGNAGGESSCFAHLLCPECGSVLDGGGHRAGCSRAS